MNSRRVTVAAAQGLHARPAALFAAVAAEQPVPVKIGRSGLEPVDASSPLALMTLGVDQGDEVVLWAEGSDAEQALTVLADLLERDPDE